MDNETRQDSGADTYWEEVGAKFTAFGASLGEALQATVNDPKAQEVLEQIRNGLHQAANEIDDAIHIAKEDPHVQQFADDANQVFTNLGQVGEETVKKARPHVIKALRSFTDALNSLISDIEEEA